MLAAHYRINQAIGISVQLLADGTTNISACEVLVKSNQLDIVKKVVDLKAPEDLKKHFNSQSLVSLNLFGKGVLVKQVAKQEEIDPRSFAQVLPNAKMEDFYIQHFMSGEKSFVAVIRKTEGDTWIQTLDSLGFTVLMLSVGAFPADHVLSQLNTYDENVLFDGHDILLNNEEQWESYRYVANQQSQFPLKLGSATIDEKLILPYAAAFQLALSPDIEPIAAQTDATDEKLAYAISNKRFKVKGFVALVVFFVALLINFVVFSTLNSSNNEMIARMSIAARNSSDLQDLSGKISEKEAILKALGWDGGINKSSLIDQLAALLPNDVQLTEIAINPLDGDATRIQRSITFSDRLIKISGHSESIIPVNEWVARCKTLKWVKNIEMNSFMPDRETNTGRFTIIIKY